MEEVLANHELERESMNVGDGVNKMCNRKNTKRKVVKEGENHGKIFNEVQCNDEWELHKSDSEAAKNNGEGVINTRATCVDEGSTVSLLPPILIDHMHHHVSLTNPTGSPSDQCSKESPCGRVGRTWKRIIHPKQCELEQGNAPSLKRPLDADEELNYQKKKRVVSQDEKEADYGMAEAVSQPHQVQ